MLCVERSFLFSVLLCLAGKCAASPLQYSQQGLDKRILGGSDASDSSYPFVVHISSPYSQPETTSCAGVIISDQFVVAPALCATVDSSATPVPLSSITIGYGSADRRKQKRAGVSKVVINSMYDTQRYTNDVAVLQLSSKLAFSDDVGSIKLYSDEVSAGNIFTLAGWGATDAKNSTGYSQTLKYGSITIGSDTACKVYTAYTGSNDKTLCTVYNSTTGSAPCIGDAGATLIAEKDGVLQLVGMLDSYYHIGTSYCGTGSTTVYYSHMVSYLPFLTTATGMSSSELASPSSPSPSNGTSSTAKSRSSNSLPTGAIAGIAVGGFAGLILLGLLVRFVYRKIGWQSEKQRFEHMHNLELKQLAEDLGGSYDAKTSTAISLFSSTAHPSDEGVPGRIPLRMRYLKIAKHDDLSEAQFADNIPRLAEVGTELTLDLLGRSHRYPDGEPFVSEYIRPSRLKKVSDYYPLLHGIGLYDDAGDILSE